jgi:hypothetical protein
MVYVPPNGEGAKVRFESRYENFIGGEWVPPKKGQYFENVSPVTGESFCEVARSTAEDIELALDAAHGAKHGDRPVKDAQRALNLDREVDVAGRIDEVDAVVAPKAGRRGGGDGDPALLFLRHPVHDRGAFVDLADLVGFAGEKEDPFGGGGLAGVDMRHDANVTDDL